MKILIGIVGEKGAGKGTLGALLSKYYSGSIEIMRFSDLLRQTLAAWGVEVNRENLQLLARVMDQGFGPGTLSRAVSHTIHSSRADIVVIDGVRWNTDLELVRSFPHNLLIYITASPEVRFGRLTHRGENVGETSMSFEQFFSEEQAQNEVFIPSIGASADARIVNEGTMEDFEVSVCNFFEKYIEGSF